ncbi:MAG: DUF3800 domain-containing protein [Thermodesulfobacteriota bacterium]
MYVDESGTKSTRDDEIWYILAGVIVSEIHWRPVNDKVDHLKRELFPDGNIEKIELHASMIRKKTGMFSKFNDEGAKNILLKLYQLIKDLPVTIIAIAINKRDLVLNYQDRDPLTDAWTFLAERFHKFLAKNYDQTGVVSYGLLVIDERTKPDDREVRQLLRSLRTYGSGYQAVDNVIEDPVSSPSHLRNIIQLADAVAYCVLRYVKHDADFNQYFEIIRERFDKGPNDEILGYGLKIFPPSQ